MSRTVGRCLILVDEQIPNTQPQWLIKIYELDLQIKTRFSVQGKNHGSIFSSRSLVLTKICCCVLIYLPCSQNLQTLGTRDCIDIPLDSLCEQELHEAPWRFQYTGYIAGLYGKSQKSISRQALACKLPSYIHREKQKIFQRKPA